MDCGCRLGYGGDCLMQTIYIKKRLGMFQTGSLYADGAFIKVADSAGSTVPKYFMY